MKLKFRAEAKDILYFILFLIFLLYLIAVGVGNITSVTHTGELVGLNPIPGLSGENLFGTLVFFVFTNYHYLAFTTNYFILVANRFN